MKIKRTYQLFISIYLIGIWLFGGVLHSFYHHLEEIEHSHKISCVLNTTDVHATSPGPELKQELCLIEYHLLQLNNSNLTNSVTISQIDFNFKEINHFPYKSPSLSYQGQSRLGARAPPLANS